MTMIILDPTDHDKLIERRRASGLDRHDEVWDGVYLMSPLANNEHQQLVSLFDRAFGTVIVDQGLGIVQPGANVSDLAQGWEHDYRCPDVVVYLNSNSATDHNTHWQGGPDFAIEVVSRYDRSREKFDFYARLNTREVLVVDRYPRALELYRLNDQGTYDLLGRSSLEQPETLVSAVIPFTFQLQPGEDRPLIRVAQTRGDQSWLG